MPENRDATPATARQSFVQDANGGDVAAPEFRRRAVLFGWVSFFQDLGSKMLVPVMPLLLTQVLGAPAIAVAMSDGVGEVSASLSRSWAGRAADRRPPMKLVRPGYALSTAAKALTGIAPIWMAVIVLRAVDRVGKGIRDAPRDSQHFDSCVKYT